MYVGSFFVMFIFFCSIKAENDDKSTLKLVHMVS